MAGNDTVVPFTSVYKKAKQKHDTINVSDGFLNTKIPEFQQYYPEMQGEFIDKYLFANSTVREENNKKISRVMQKPSTRTTLEGPF